MQLLVEQTFHLQCEDCGFLNRPSAMYCICCGAENEQDEE